MVILIRSRQYAARWRQQIRCLPGTSLGDRLHRKPKHGHTLRFHLCPAKNISFDGFINNEGRRFGVPYSYAGADETDFARGSMKNALSRRSSRRCRSKHRSAGFRSCHRISPLPNLTLTRSIQYKRDRLRNDYLGGVSVEVGLLLALQKITVSLRLPLRR